MQLSFTDVMTGVFALAALFLFVGNVLLGVAVWRSVSLPWGAGAVWLLSAVSFYLLGAVWGSVGRERQSRGG